MAAGIRSADGTKVRFDVNGLPTTVTSYHAYAVDPTGTPTYLGPLTVTNGVAKAEFSTPMNQFMLVVSPNMTWPTSTVTFVWALTYSASGSVLLLNVFSSPSPPFPKRWNFLSPLEKRLHGPFRIP